MASRLVSWYERDMTFHVDEVGLYTTVRKVHIGDVLLRIENVEDHIKGGNIHIDDVNIYNDAVEAHLNDVTLHITAVGLHIEGVTFHSHAVLADFARTPGNVTVTRTANHSSSHAAHHPPHILNAYCTFTNN